MFPTEKDWKAYQDCSPPALASDAEPISRHNIAASSLINPDELHWQEM